MNIEKIVSNSFQINKDFKDSLNQKNVEAATSTFFVTPKDL